MDRRERRLDPEEVLRCLVESIQARIWTAVPAVVQSFNAAAMTVQVQPAMSCQFRNAAGVWETLNLPALSDCPVVWPGGGGCTLTFPIEAGDECLVVFASRCIDGWWSQGMAPGSAVPPPPEVRMHNLSDGFALVGVRSKPRAYAPVTGGAQLQSDDGQAYVQINPTTHAMKLQTSAALTISASGGVNINGATISAAGEITDANGFALGTHEHAAGTYTAPSGGGLVTGKSGEPTLGT